jgi:hypothetical protein
MIKSRFAAFICVITFALYAPFSVCAADDLDGAINRAAGYVYKGAKNPQVASEGGEWSVIALAESGYGVPADYYARYYGNVETYVREKNGVLHDRKYTEYARVILGVTAADYDPRDVAGYDLTLPLGDFDKTARQGINGLIWALIALDSANYTVPKNPGAKTQATRDLYIEEILKRQLPDGGFNVTAGDGVQSDPDITGMALQALAAYRGRPAVKAAVNKALIRLSKAQRADGGYVSRNVENCESAVQVLVALCKLGIRTDDGRFVKSGHTIVDNILKFQNADGGFGHAIGEGNNPMASEQALYGLALARRANIGAPSSSAIKTFDDISGHVGQKAVEALAERGVVSGKTDVLFDPDGHMTRAEFAAVVVRALDLPEKQTRVFGDVTEGDWYVGYVGAAYSSGVVSGVSAVEFNPDGVISREQAAVMVARAAKLCGLDANMDAAEIRETLKNDYFIVADWARSGVAFCLREKILTDLRPKEAVKRYEVADMVYKMMDRAELP